MTITIKKSKPLPEATTPAVPNAPVATKFDSHRKKVGHAKPLIVTLDLNQPGRLRVGHVMNLLSISHATLYAKMKTGHIPKPDGKDGKRPYWRTTTIRPLLEA